MNQKILRPQNIFIFLLCVFCPLFSFGQGYDITNLEVIPEYPHPSDEVKITFTVVTSSGANYNYENHSVVGNEIEIETCFGINITTVFLTFIDTISLGILPVGNYHVNFDCYADYGGTCIGSPDDTLSETLDFLVSATNSLDINRENDFTIYPNPSDQLISIQSHRCIDNITVYNSSGEILLMASGYSQKEVVIDIGTLQSGVYSVCVESAGTLRYSRFIKV